ncbi:MAG: peptidyl-prolyl cis-trans isomerase, partial [Pseudomonadota bacterium]|nr:peptidyl-prolyl cis-trans isomerase [Pseudomonadota bacterium]
LKKGQITQTPVKTQFGWHVIRLDDTRDAKIPSYEDVKPQLLEMMTGDQNWQRSKFQAMLKELREKAKIQ